MTTETLIVKAAHPNVATAVDPGRPAEGVVTRSKASAYTLGVVAEIGNCSKVDIV